MAKAKFLIISDQTDMLRRANLFIDGTYKGGTWWQETVPPMPQALFPVMRGIWTLKEEKNGKAGKVADRVTLLSKEYNPVASFRLENYQVGNKYYGRMTPRDKYPNAVGELWETPFTLTAIVAPPITKKFTICQTGGLGISYGPAAMDTLLFEITDMESGEKANYTYEAYGVGAGVGPKNLPKGVLKKLPEMVGKFELPGNVNLKGPLNDFTSNGWRGVREFGGDASMGGLNVAMGSSAGYTYFAFNDISISGFNGGSQIGLPSASMTTGTFKLVK